MSPASRVGGSPAGAPRACDPERLRRHVGALEGERHPLRSPDALEAALDYCEDALAARGLAVERHAFEFRSATYENVVATLPGRDPAAPRVLVGAHVDTVAGTPGADDNASGVAGLLELARLLASGDAAPAWTPRATVELAVFNLEERQRLTYRVGSRRWAARARERGVRYAGALVFEMIGYTSAEPGSQRVPPPLGWLGREGVARLVPGVGAERRGDFLACVGDADSGELVDAFVDAARAVAPSLRVAVLEVPLRGWVVPATRRSDNASFWSEGYPAVMLTDTADLRNPHYHRGSDRSETLDYGFMADVVDATAEAVRRLTGAGEGGAPGPG